MEKTYVVKFTFNEFMENTYIVHNGKSCVIIDPGCNSSHEEKEISEYIDAHHLTPLAILLTHGHLDHIMGVTYLSTKYNLPYYLHALDIETANRSPLAAQMYGIPRFIPVEKSPDVLIKDGDVLTFDHMSFEVIHTPGHSPGHVVFYKRDEHYVINGDVLFAASFGRTDLPGGDHATLVETIFNTMFSLPDETLVYCGHGPETTIGMEKVRNMIHQYT